MKFNSELIKKAHEMAREIKNEYGDVDYKTQFGLCLSYLLNNEEEIRMVELKGSEKQIKWAEEIRRDVIETLEKLNTISSNVYNYNDEEQQIYKSEERFIQAKEDLAKTLEVAKNTESAKFFIENREELIKALRKLGDIKSFTRLSNAYSHMN